MAESPTPLTERPVLAGLAALLSVAVVVGLLAGGVVLLGSKIVGIGEVEAGSADGPSAGATLHLPEPVKTSAPSGPRITLNVDPEDQGGDEVEDEADAKAEAEKKAKAKAEKEKLVLEAGQTAVQTMGRIDLRGTYLAGEGAILQVQRKDGGTWSDFPVTVSVRNGAYTTYVVTGKPGETKFRVLDTDSGKKSNVVTVTIG